MTNLVKHFNDSALYYDIDKAIQLKIDISLLTLTLLHSSGELALETFNDAFEQTKRLRQLLDLTGTSSSQYPS